MTVRAAIRIVFRGGKARRNVVRKLKGSLFRLRGVLSYYRRGWLTSEWLAVRVGRETQELFSWNSKPLDSSWLSKSLGGVIPKVDLITCGSNLSQSHGNINFSVHQQTNSNLQLSVLSSSTRSSYLMEKQFRQLPKRASPQNKLSSQ